MTGRALIIGGRGFVGAHATRAFVTAGWTVHLFGPPAAQDLIPDLAGSIVEHAGSVEDHPALSQAVAAARPSLLLSFAAFSEGRSGLMRSGEADADRALAVNVAGFRNVLETARAAGVGRVLWSSSTVVYGPPELYEAERVDEDAACRPRTFYGLTKVMAEQVACFYRDRFGMAVTGLRLPLVIGPGLWYQGAAAEIAKLFAAAVPNGSWLMRGPSASIDLMYVKDVAAAFLAAADRGGLGEIYNINGFTASYGDLAAAVAGQVPGYRPALEPVEPPFAFPLIDAARFTREAGFSPRFDLTATVADYLAEQRRQAA
jgi:UDP-glucose 4-epimerase